MLSEQTVDYLVVGAGSSGCVLAHRLSEDETVSVMLLEAGGWDDVPEMHAVDLPSLFALWTADWSTQYDWGYVTEPQPSFAERRIPIARGKVLGGCSSINALMYVRGNRLDYEHWNALGNKGWSYEEVLPYFKRSEDYEGGASHFRGAGGPLSVVQHANPTPVAQAFVAAGQELGFGGAACDYNGERQEDCAFYYQTTQTRERKRCSTATAFLHPILGRANLTLKVGAQATRLLVEGQRVVGLEYLGDGVVHTVRVEREVILCGGVFETPKLLMLSGIGPADALRAQGITDILVDLPGVGQHLQDHLFVPVCYQAKQAHPAASLVSEAGLFMHTRSEMQGTPPDLQFTFGTAKFLGNNPAPNKIEGPGFTFAPVALRPQSMGSIALRSHKPTDNVLIQANYLDNDVDVEVLIKGIELSRELAHTHAFADFRDEELFPGKEALNRKQLSTFVRANATTLWHPVGTCRMGIGRDAVVDPRLCVYGVEGVRVADASIMPSIVAGNTNAPCIMIGEKAADLVLKRFSAYESF